jgi:hypothetical protein
MSTQSLDFNWDGSGLHLLVGQPLGVSWGSGSITESGGSLLFDISLSQNLAPNFFYNGGGSTIGIDLNVSDASISNILFDGGALGHATTGGTVGQAGTFNYGIACTNCGIFGNLGGSPQATHVSFTIQDVSTPLTLHNLVSNPSGFVVAATTQILLGTVDCPVDGVGSIGAVAGVPEPATWAMLMLGFAALAVISRRKLRRATA